MQVKLIQYNQEAVSVYLFYILSFTVDVTDLDVCITHYYRVPVLRKKKKREHQKLEMDGVDRSTYLLYGTYAILSQYFNYCIRSLVVCHPPLDKNEFQFGCSLK